MSRIDIGEIRDFAFQLRAANQTGRKIIQGVKTTVTNYIEDGSLKGKAVEKSKNYYQMTYIPLCDTITEAMNESEERLKRYIQDFHDQVDPSPNAKIDADGLYELGQMIDRIESKKEALYQRMNSSTEGQMQTYRSLLATAYKQENILEKYLAFEQSHGAFFDHLTDLVQGIQQTVRELQSNIQFNSQTGGYDLSKLNFATVNRMRKTLGKASATDTTIYDFAAYSKVKQGGMWVLSKDGKVDIKATEAYNTASFNGELPKENNQATEEGELLKATLESLKQNKDPITGQEISKAQGFGILTSLVFGYTTKKYRGKKLSISKCELEKIKNASESALPKSSIGIAQSRINIANGPTRFSSSDNAGFNHIVDRHFNPNRNAGQFTISQDKLKNILSSKETVEIEVKEIPGNQFERIINIGETAGTIKPSIPENGGKPTNYIRILTDKAGNLITAYPIPKP
ncbi:LXG domain-containing protein [Listeria monocytogenes]|nr:LXG domain-containing protein [Listeria monocytogenes]EKZ0978111.1 LXG domain-containing protein [Listeria monocytogenes]EKZ0983974.1 LXG domain-containing protein [Listeria monocytogenes]EKZ0986854.1 LXG domain-containing protein [Listeria monocytogenes]EKZ0995542.1 LXG domain-containing protein [Listeria monocytogenes]